MHERICEGSVSRKDQQSCRRQVQSSYSHPAPPFQSRQGVEHELTAIRVLARCHLVSRLVVDDVTMILGAALHREQSAVERNPLRAFDVITELRNTTVNGQASFADPGFYFTTGTMPRSREDFLNALSQPGRATD